MATILHLGMIGTTTAAVIFGQMMFDFRLMLFIAPALLLAFIAQIMVRSAYSSASQIRAKMSGYAAARYILDSAGLRGWILSRRPVT
jgi:uncharacterized protein